MWNRASHQKCLIYYCNEFPYRNWNFELFRIILLLLVSVSSELLRIFTRTSPNFIFKLPILLMVICFFHFSLLSFCQHLFFFGFKYNSIVWIESFAMFRFMSLCLRRKKVKSLAYVGYAPITPSRSRALEFLRGGPFDENGCVLPNNLQKSLWLHTVDESKAIADDAHIEAWFKPTKLCSAIEWVL